MIKYNYTMEQALGGIGIFCLGREGNNAPVWNSFRLSGICDFSASSITGISPATIQFYDNTSGSTAWGWDFENDGEIDSTEQNPVHVYEQPGLYSVNLTVRNEYGNFSTLKINYITVLQGVVANFTTDTINGNTVYFIDLSIGSGTYTYFWDFGDGSNSTEQNPEHTFTSFGIYNVTLNTTNAFGSNITTKTIKVDVQSATLEISPKSINSTDNLETVYIDSDVISYSTSSDYDNIMSLISTGYGFCGLIALVLGAIIVLRAFNYM
jgi:PKD repeat protein